MEEYFLLPLHEIFKDEDTIQKIHAQTIAILQDEWPRAEELRKRAISRSCNGLPTSFSLVRKSEPHDAHGYCQISPVPGLEDCCFLESVVIQRDLRGTGLGRILVKFVEDYVGANEFACKSRIVLTAKPDQAGFYKRLNYTSCEPIAYTSGSAAKLIPPIFLERLAAVNQSKNVKSAKPTIERTNNVEWLHKLLV